MNTYRVETKMGTFYTEANNRNQAVNNIKNQYPLIRLFDVYNVSMV